MALSRAFRVGTVAALLSGLIVTAAGADEALTYEPETPNVLIDAQATVQAELRALARREGFEPALANAFFSTRASRTLAFAASADGSKGVFLVATSEGGEQDRLEPGVYTLRPVDAERYVVLLDGQPFSTTLTIKEQGGDGWVEAIVGDDLCGGTSGSLHDMCTRLVACHYLDLWCPW